MLIQLTIGTATILATMAVMVGFVTTALRLVKVIEAWLADHRLNRYQFFLMLSAAVILVLAANTVCVWIWAIVFRLIGVFATLEEAVYFSIVSFTTVGYGDVVAEKGWRILGGFVSVNGLLAFGIFTAFLIEIIREISSRYAPRRKSDRRD